jgi:hypothetical protein
MYITNKIVFFIIITIIYKYKPKHKTNAKSETNQCNSNKPF